MSTAAVLAGNEAIIAALGTVPGMRLAGLGDPIYPPVAVVVPPDLEWGARFSEGPTLGRWLVWLVVAHSGLAVTGQLLGLVDPIAAAIESHTDAVVTTAVLGIYSTAKQGDFPAYQIKIEMPL